MLSVQELCKTHVADQWVLAVLSKETVKSIHGSIQIVAMAFGVSFVQSPTQCHSLAAGSHLLVASLVTTVFHSLPCEWSREYNMSHVSHMRDAPMIWYSHMTT